MKIPFHVTRFVAIQTYKFYFLVWTLMKVIFLFSIFLCYLFLFLSSSTMFTEDPRTSFSFHLPLSWAWRPYSILKWLWSCTGDKSSFLVFQSVFKVFTWWGHFVNDTWDINRLIHLHLVLFKLSLNPHGSILLFHNMPWIHHFLIIKITHKEHLTRNIIIHVFGLKCILNIFCRFVILI